MKPATKGIVRYGRGQTMLGEAMVFTTDKGVCALRLVGRKTFPQLLREMQGQLPQAELREDTASAKRAFRQVAGWLAGKLRAADLTLDLHGTPFQTRVWREMLRVPHGTTCSYTELAERVGKPAPIRAVASACARNPVGLLVPCHRIVRQDGSLGGYYWGLDKKKQLLDHEKATSQGAKKGGKPIRGQ